MKLPAIEIPNESSDKARQWAYRLAVLPFESTVEDVALLIQAAMADRGTCRTCNHLIDGLCLTENRDHPSAQMGRPMAITRPDWFGCTGYAPKEAA